MPDHEDVACGDSQAGERIQHPGRIAFGLEVAEELDRDRRSGRPGHDPGALPRPRVRAREDAVGAPGLACEMRGERLERVDARG